MFERFTEGAKAVLVEARDLALELGSPVIDVGHVLYGCAEGREETAGRPLRDAGVTAVLIRGQMPRARVGGSADPIDADALRAIGVDVDDVRRAVEAAFGPGALDRAPDRRTGSQAGGRPRFTHEAKRSIERALRSALELGAKHMAPGHLLLGVLQVDDEVVARVLEQAGTTRAALEAAVASALRPAA